MMTKNPKDTLDSGRRFVLGKTTKSRLELDFFNLYGWALSFVADKKVLDVGCGSGLGSFIWAHSAREVRGVGISNEAISYANENYRRKNLSFTAGNFLDTDLNLPLNYFDIVISTFVLEQIQSDRQLDFLKLLKQYTTDDGLIILATSNRKITSPFNREGMSSNPLVIRDSNKKELEFLFRETGLKPIQWFGQRIVFAPLASLFIHGTINVFRRVFGIDPGVYSIKPSPEVKPLKFYLQPLRFIVIIEKR